MSQSPLFPLIQENAQKTDNKCGLTAVTLCSRSGLSLDEVKVELNQLCKAKLIRWSDGIHGKLFLLK